MPYIAPDTLDIGMVVKVSIKVSSTEKVPAYGITESRVPNGAGFVVRFPNGTSMNISESDIEHVDPLEVAHFWKAGRFWVK